MTQSETTTKTGIIVVVGRDESIGYGKWGSGETVEQALRTFLKVGGSVRHGYTILEFAEADQFKGIDALGDVHYTGEGPQVTEVPARKKR
jgi:hypothetical protein